MAVAYKKKIGFHGQLLIEPKPKEPTKHQYDYDAMTVVGFLKHFGLEKDFKVSLLAVYPIIQLYNCLCKPIIHLKDSSKSIEIKPIILFKKIFLALLLV